MISIHSRTQTTGFTLFELMVVLAILGMLIGLVGPQVMKQLSSAKSSTAKLQIEDLGAALDLFYLDNGRYPSSNEGLQALVQAPADTSGWNGPYLKKNNIPQDPWNNDYHYRSPGENGAFDLYSYGADNAPGGEKDNADVVSWE
jgi:general secretion pathway protein G